MKHLNWWTCQSVGCDFDCLPVSRFLGCNYNFLTELLRKIYLLVFFFMFIRDLHFGKANLYIIHFVRIAYIESNLFDSFDNTHDIYPEILKISEFSGFFWS